MEILGTLREKRTVYVGVISIAIFGLILALLTWQTLRRQERVIREHMELTSAAVLQAVSSSLWRGPMTLRMPGDGPEAARFGSATRDFFRELENSGDILFVGFVDERGNSLSPHPGTPTGNDQEPRTPSPAITFPPEATARLASEGRWQGQTVSGTTPVYVAARSISNIARMRPGQHRWSNQPEFDSGQEHHGRQRMRDRFAATPFGSFITETDAPRRFLVVAVDMEKHFAVSASFRRTALFQTAYALLAAVIMWALAALFLARRKLAGKAVYLERFQTSLWDNLPDALLIAGPSGTITAANPAARSMLAGEGEAAASAISIVGKNMTDFALPFPGIPGGTPGAGRDKAQRHELFRDGKLLEVRSLPFRGENDTPALMVILRDRTRLHTLEKNLASAEKRAAIGALATGVAHEIRNPLSALRGFAQYFAKKLAGKNPEEEYARTMVREADRLNRVITDLLYLSRPRDLAPAPVELEAVRRELEVLLTFELREKHVAFPGDLRAPIVFADKDALKQALLNLALNALEALGSMPETDTPRRITLSSRAGTRGDTPPNAARAVMDGPSHAPDAPGVWVTLADTGPGMPPEAAARAFEPFFTTKSKGTGLGLALVHSIMNSHNGEAATGSIAEGGCAVSLFFPDEQGEPSELGGPDTPEASATTTEA